MLDTPTLQSMKWWNSNLGLAATHAVVYAQLIMPGGAEKGVHVFMLQVRDEHHMPLPGIEMGDVGAKLGDDAIDTGYMRLRGVRIPREHMLAKRQYVTADGRYVKRGGGGGGAGGSNNKTKKKKGGSKMHYATMMQARAGMINIAGGRLACGATTATRYACVRKQARS